MLKTFKNVGDVFLGKNNGARQTVTARSANDRRAHIVAKSRKRMASVPLRAKHYLQRGGRQKDTIHKPRLHIQGSHTGNSNENKPLRFENNAASVFLTRTRWDSSKNRRKKNAENHQKEE